MVIGNWCIILKHWCLRLDNIAANRYHNRPLREKFPPLIIPTMLRIKTYQPWARFVIHQSPTTVVVQIVLLSKLTLSPDSGNCETNHKQNPLYMEKPTMRKVRGWLAPSSRISLLSGQSSEENIKFLFVKSWGINITIQKFCQSGFIWIVTPQIFIHWLKS